MIRKLSAANPRNASGQLPIYARALDLKEDYFDEYFALPFYRMRQTRYPVVDALNEDSGAGIAPHVDTSFFTVLAVTGPGLVVCESRARRDQTLKARELETHRNIARARVEQGASQVRNGSQQTPERASSL